jgi:hypothetical protein
MKYGDFRKARTILNQIVPQVSIISSNCNHSLRQGLGFGHLDNGVEFVNDSVLLGHNFFILHKVESRQRV